MEHRNLWFALAAIAASSIAAAPLATANGHDLGIEIDHDGSHDLSDVVLHDDDIVVFDDDVGVFETCRGASTHDVGLGTIADLSSTRRSEFDFDQDVDYEENTVLLAIALANNGASDIDFADVRDFRATERFEVSNRQRADLDRDDVFNALALGVDADEGQLETLECIADVDSEVVGERTVSHRVDLEENDVLLAIALTNSIGGGLSFNDVADIDVDSATSLSRDQTIDLDRDDTFLALALGAGGR